MWLPSLLMIDVYNGCILKMWMDTQCAKKDKYLLLLIMLPQDVTSIRLQ